MPSIIHIAQYIIIVYCWFFIFQQGGLTPFMLVGTMATADLGAIDPLAELGEVAQQHKMWFHVDAALGGFLVLTDEFNSTDMGQHQCYYFTF